MRQVFETHDPDAVMHLAAESHVDRSIDGPADFVRTNVVGTFILLEAARRHYAALNPARKAAFRFHHVSTDEVFGALGHGDAPFTETTPYDPAQPVFLDQGGVRSSGPGLAPHLRPADDGLQHLQQLRPLAIPGETDPAGDAERAGRAGRCRSTATAPTSATGSYVDDHAAALVRVIETGQPGATYAIGGRQPRSNLDVVKAICAHLDRRPPDPAGPRQRLIRFVTDRPGHDFRYEIDPSRTEAALGWKAPHDFETGLGRTIDWYLANRTWWEAVRSARYAGQRLGTAA